MPVTPRPAELGPIRSCFQPAEDQHDQRHLQEAKKSAALDTAGCSGENEERDSVMAHGPRLTRPPAQVNHSGQGIESRPLGSYLAPPALQAASRLLCDPKDAGERPFEFLDPPQRSDALCLGR